MGIKDVLKYLRTNCKKGCRSRALEKFSGKVIAIDGPKFFWARWKIAYKNVLDNMDYIDDYPDPELALQECFESFSEFLIKWMNLNIVPVFVFDGEPRLEKLDLKKVRDDKFKTSGEKAKKLLERVRNQDPLEVDDKLLTELRSALYESAKPVYKHLLFFKDFLNELGLPWFQALHDAEQLCAILVIEGYAAAAYTDDQDIFAFGCPEVITKMTNYRDNEVEYIDLNKVLDEMEITYFQFVDICILTGCDFNKKLDGIGFITAYKLVKAYGSIDNIPLTKTGEIDKSKVKGFRLRKNCSYHIKDINHVTCKRIFRFLPSTALIREGRFSMEVYNIDGLQSLCKKVNITSELAKLVKSRNQLGIPEISKHRTFYLI